MDLRILFDLAVIAVAGMFLAKGSGQRSRSVTADNTEVGESGVYTPALDFTMNASGQGLPGYLGVAQFNYKQTDKANAMDQVKGNAVDVMQGKKNKYVSPGVDNTYNQMTDGMTAVVPYMKTIGVSLPGTDLPGTYPAM